MLQSPEWFTGVSVAPRWILRESWYLREEEESGANPSGRFIPLGIQIAFLVIPNPGRWIERLYNRGRRRDQEGIAGQAVQEQDDWSLWITGMVSIAQSSTVPFTRELQIMRMLNHRNVVCMKHCFYSNGDKPDELYLNLVLEYVPDTLYRRPPFV